VVIEEPRDSSPDAERLGLSLRQSEDLFRRMVDALHVGVLIQGPRSEVLFANAAAVRLLGVPAPRMLGKTSLDASPLVIHEDGTPFPGEDHPAPRVLATGKPVRDVVMGFYRPAVKDRVWLLVNADPQTGPDGRVEQVVCTFSDVTSGRDVTERLRESERRYRQLVEQAPDIIYRTDFRGHFTYVNPAASRVTEYLDTELVGKHYLELVREDHRARVEAVLVDQFRRRVPSTHAEFVAVTKSGREVWIAQNVDLLLEGARVQGYQAVARDVTERKTAEEALEKVSRLKDEFVANVSHDLRAPLNGVIAAATRLLGTWLTEEQREQVLAIDRSGRDLLDMIDDISAFSQADADRRPEAAAASAADAAHGAAPRVLVAEDDAVNRKVVASMLQGLGYRVDAVANGREAVEACRRSAYDVVLMDCQMPEMDGLSATARIREHEGSSRRTPIVAMTASALPGYEEQCRAAGMDEYLAKPVRLQVLRATVRKWVRLTGSGSVPPEHR
jgi:PAS domain S-box-containing protein